MDGELKNKLIVFLKENFIEDMVINFDFILNVWNYMFMMVIRFGIWIKINKLFLEWFFVIKIIYVLIFFIKFDCCGVNFVELMSNDFD